VRQRRTSWLELRPDLHRQTVLTGRPSVLGGRSRLASCVCVCVRVRRRRRGSVLKQLARERQGLYG
jgi:hypothetical protein